MLRAEGQGKRSCAPRCKAARRCSRRSPRDVEGRGASRFARGSARSPRWAERHARKAVGWSASAGSRTRRRRTPATSLASSLANGRSAPQVRRAREATPPNPLLEASLDDRGELARHVGREGHRRARHDGRREPHHPFSVERRPPDEGLEEDHAERPDVGARVDVLRGAHLLRRHVERRAPIALVCVDVCCAPPPRVVIFEMPKSSILSTASPSVRYARKRFAGLRSRCTMPSEWASAIASHAWSR